jgi:alanine dehydrogenase
MRFVSNEVAESVLSMEDAIRAIQAAYTGPVDSRNTPRRTVVDGDGAGFRVLPSAPPGARYFGAKIMGATTHSGFRAAGSAIVLFDREASEIAALVDGKFITGCRTAATSAAALDRLAPPGPIRLGVLGSGFEASMHVRAFAAVRPLEEITVFSPTPRRRAAFARTMTDTFEVACHAAESAEEAADVFRTSADVVLAAARSRGEKPILFGEDLGPGVTVVSIGSTVPRQREIDASVVGRCDLIVCDDVGEVVDETGDMIAAADAGLSFRDKCVSLHALMSGEVEQYTGIRMFKSVGSGLQDVVIAGLVLDLAIEAGRATPLPMAFAT